MFGRKKRLSVLLMSALLVMSTAFTGCGGGSDSSNKSAKSEDQTYTFKLAHVNNPNHPYTLASKKFAEIVCECQPKSEPLAHEFLSHSCS